MEQTIVELPVEASIKSESENLVHSKKITKISISKDVKEFNEIHPTLTLAISKC